METKFKKKSRKEFQRTWKGMQWMVRGIHGRGCESWGGGWATFFQTPGPKDNPEFNFIPREPGSFYGLLPEQCVRTCRHIGDLKGDILEKCALSRDGSSPGLLAMARDSSPTPS